MIAARNINRLMEGEFLSKSYISYLKMLSKRFQTTDFGSEFTQKERNFYRSPHQETYKLVSKIKQSYAEFN